MKAEHKKQLIIVGALAGLFCVVGIVLVVLGFRNYAGKQAVAVRVQSQANETVGSEDSGPATGSDERGLAASAAQKTATEGENENLPQWVSPVVRSPRLKHRVFRSEAVKSDVSYHIYLPEQYETDKARRFPVMYWLHGGGGKPDQDRKAGGGKGPAVLSKHFGDAMRDGKIPPMLVVFPNGLRKGMWCNFKDGSTPIESILMNELIPDIDAKFRTIPSREGRMIAGHSMGGYGAARLGFKYPGIFSAVSFRGAGPLQQVFTPSVGPKGNAGTRARLLRTVYGGNQGYFKKQSPWFLADKNADLLRGKMHIRQLIGDKDYTLPANREFHAHLTRLNIPHTFKVLPGVEHNALQLIDVLGADEDYWAFYRTVFSSGESPIGP